MARNKLIQTVESNSRLFAMTSDKRKSNERPVVEDVRRFSQDEQDAMERSSFYARMMQGNRGVL